VANRFNSETLDETEDELSDEETILHYVIVTNPGDTLAYLKFWDDVPGNVDPASDPHVVRVGVPPGATIVTWLGDVRCAAGCSIGAVRDAGVGVTDPVTDLVATVFYN